MIGVGLLALQAVLALLAAYHLIMGSLAVVAPRTAAGFARSLYGTVVAEDPRLRYAIRMLGLYALALGSLLALAAWRPGEHREVIVVAAALQTARALCRVVLHRELVSAFGVPPLRNAIAIAVLVAEAAVLYVVLYVVL